MNVIFDMDGVISDSEAVYLAGYLHAAELYGLPEDDMRRAVDLATGVTDDQERRIMTETFGYLPQFDMDRTYKACRDYFANVVETGQMQLKPGAKEILQDKVLQRHDVLRYFDVIVSGDMVEHGKPDPEIFLSCAAKMGISSEEFKETYVIEDSHNGIRAAFDAGMQPVMVPDRLAPNEEMRQKAAAILSSLNDLIAWLHDRG